MKRAYRWVFTIFYALPFVKCKSNKGKQPSKSNNFSSKDFSAPDTFPLLKEEKDKFFKLIDTILGAENQEQRSPIERVAKAIGARIINKNEYKKHAWPYEVHFRNERGAIVLCWPGDKVFLFFSSAKEITLCKDLYELEAYLQAYGPSFTLNHNARFLRSYNNHAVAQMVLEDNTGQERGNLLCITQKSFTGLIEEE